MRRTSESGNALFYILIAVGLLAGLTYAVTQGNRGGHAMNEERIRMTASEIIEYSGIVGKTVAQLRLRGCGANELNFFAADATTDFTNGSAPPDNSCDIFHLSGGGMQYRDAPENSGNLAETVFFGGNMEVENIGQTCGDASCSELLMLYRHLDLDVCRSLNDLIGNTNPSGNPPTDTSLSFVAFQGGFTYNSAIADEAGGSALAGQQSGCIQDTTTGQYHFYKVLVAR